MLEMLNESRLSKLIGRFVCLGVFPVIAAPISFILCVIKNRTLRDLYSVHGFILCAVYTRCFGLIPYVNLKTLP